MTTLVALRGRYYYLVALIGRAGCTSIGSHTRTQIESALSQQSLVRGLEVTYCGEGVLALKCNIMSNVQLSKWSLGWSPCVATTVGPPPGQRDHSQPFETSFVE